MGVVVRCPLPTCNRLTGWQYPTFAWASSRLPGIPQRCLLSDSRAQGYVGWCEDPFGHVNSFLASRGLPALVADARYSPPEEEPEDPTGDELDDLLDRTQSALFDL